MSIFEVESLNNTEPKGQIRPNLEFEPIPEESVDGWKKVPVRECGEKLVPVGSFSPFSDCDTSAVYFGERGSGPTINMVGEPVDRSVSLITHFVREGVLQKMQEAQNLLPEGYYFKFYDNFRPVEVQQALFNSQKEIFKNEHPDWDDSQLDTYTQTYVSLPSPNEERGTTHPSPHSTGGVVDLTIIKLSEEGQNSLAELNDLKFTGKLNHPIDNSEEIEFSEVINWIDEEAKNSNWAPEYKQIVLNNWLSEFRYFKQKARIFHNQSQILNMGTDFDHLGPESGSRYFEELAQKQELNEDQKEALQNRRFFYKVMKTAGFSNYPEEWWHWSYGDNMDAVNTDKDYAIYGGAKLSEENKTIEWARQGVYEDAKTRVGSKELFDNSVEEDPTKI